MAEVKSGDQISLREYVDVRFKAQEQAVAAALAAAEKAVAAALSAADRAVAKAEAASEKRFESVNEFRSALSDQSRTFMPRAEAEQAIDANKERIEVLTNRLNARDEQGRGMNQSWGIVSVVVGLVIAAISVAIVIFKQ